MWIDSAINIYPKSASAPQPYIVSFQPPFKCNIYEWNGYRFYQSYSLQHFWVMAQVVLLGYYRWLILLTIVWLIAAYRRTVKKKRSAPTVGTAT